MKALLTLADVLLRPEAFDWRFALFLPKQREWALHTQCAVLDSQYEEDPEPELTQEYGFIEAFDIHTVQQIIENLKQQLGHPSPEQCLAALRYYFANDAFIELRSVPRPGI